MVQIEAYTGLLAQEIERRPVWLEHKVAEGDMR